MPKKIKPNADSFYRVITGEAAYNDIVQSGSVRTNAESKPKASGKGVTLGNRPTAAPSFSKGKIALEYAASNPNHYVVASKDPSIKPSTMGRHGKGTTHFPTGADGKPSKVLPASSVDVYRHAGKGKYELVYSKGKQVVSPKAAVKAGAKAVAKRALPAAAAYGVGKALKEKRYGDVLGEAAWATIPSGIMYETAKRLPKETAKDAKARKSRNWKV